MKKISNWNAKSEMANPSNPSLQTDHDFSPHESAVNPSAPNPAIDYFQTDPLPNILTGYFHDQANELFVTFVQPPRPLTEAPGGWAHVFNSLRRGDCEAALQFNDYLVIQIDADVQEEPGFDVPRREGGRELTDLERVDRIITKLKSYIDPAFYATNKDRILFAVTVDAVECWLLPLLYNDNRAEKTTGCLESANRALRQADRAALSAGETKFPNAYEKASRGYLKHKTLMASRSKNASLDYFIQQLDELRARREKELPAASPNSDEADSTLETDLPDTGGNSPE
jgi:hypothetical protein